MNTLISREMRSCTIEDPSLVQTLNLDVIFKLEFETRDKLSTTYLHTAYTSKHNNNSYLPTPLVIQNIT